MTTPHPELPLSLQVPSHEYPAWLRRARAAFNLDFRRVVSKLDCPSTLREAVHLATDLGRRMRPSLYYAFWKSLTNEYPVNESASPAVAVEFFHAAAIIVDDIADGEVCRRNKQPLHRRFGTDIAVITSHYLVAQGLRALEAAPQNERLAAQWHRDYGQACLGQAYDYVRDPTLTLPEQQRRSIEKTVAFFRFIGEALDALHGTTIHSPLFTILGESFQIGNDVIDLLGFEASERHAQDELYTLRLSYLIPQLVHLGIVREDELFTQLPYREHVRIAREARSGLDSPREMLDHQNRQAIRRVKSLGLPTRQQHMASSFIKDTAKSSFWRHEHHD